MNEEQKIELDKLISQNSVVDQTDMIRTLKQSIKIRQEIDTMMKIKTEHAFKGDSNISMVSPMFKKCQEQCPFLYKYYSMLFHKILKDDIDMGTFDKFIEIVEEIEDGKLSQHEGAFKFGTLAKSLYIDDVLSTADMVDSDGNKQTSRVIAPPPAKDISWTKYKRSRDNITRKLKITKAAMEYTGQN
jgi:hypothetical protein